jgi:hypothetical protein
LALRLLLVAGFETFGSSGLGRVRGSHAASSPESEKSHLNEKERNVIPVHEADDSRPPDIGGPRTVRLRGAPRTETGSNRSLAGKPTKKADRFGFALREAILIDFEQLRAYVRRSEFIVRSPDLNPQ